MYRAIPDTLVTFLALTTFLATLRIYQRGTPREYIVAGLCAELTASAKYNGAFILLSVVTAPLIRHGHHILRKPHLYMALLSAAMGFLATTPYAVLDYAAFINKFRWGIGHYSSGGHPSMEGGTALWYLTHMVLTAGAVYGCALLEIAYEVATRSARTLLLSVFPLGYLMVIGSLPVRNERSFLPATPFLFLLAAVFFVRVSDWVRYGSAARSYRWPTALVGCLWVIALGQPLVTTCSQTAVLVIPDTRAIARQWIELNLPEARK